MKKPLKPLTTQQKELIPDVAFFYYRDRANISEIMRRLNVGRAIINRIIEEGHAARYAEEEYGDSTPEENKPYPGHSRSTRGRFL